VARRDRDKVGVDFGSAGVRSLLARFVEDVEL
jgi:hypothetical protein